MSATFCWLPPLSNAVVVADDGVLMRNRRIHLDASSFSRLRSMIGPRVTFRKWASVIFSLTLKTANYALDASLSRHVAYSGANRVLGTGEALRDPIENIFAAIRGVCAEQNAAQGLSS